jgi:nucleoside triphosphate diphosphatase
VSAPEGEGAAIKDLLAIMRRLRAPDGCAWDRQQSFASVAPYTIEEAYEVADAIERGDMADLKDELGDLLFQVVFHAQMASEAGSFDFAAVARAISDKLIRRHPHVFGEAGQRCIEEQKVAWEDIKAKERSGRAEVGHLAGVPRALPALLRAYKLSSRAARVGFDFEHAEQCADKVAEELAEVREAAAQVERVQSVDRAQLIEEIGDLLFAAANLARKLEVDAETALRAANDKFERRFRAMESLARERGELFANLDLAAQERLWQAVKRTE